MLFLLQYATQNKTTHHRNESIIAHLGYSSFSIQAVSQQGNAAETNIFPLSQIKIIMQCRGTEGNSSTKGCISQEDPKNKRIKLAKGLFCDVDFVWLRKSTMRGGIPSPPYSLAKIKTSLVTVSFPHI